MNLLIGAVLVIGGGIAGIQTSLDLVDLGLKVYLVEKKPSIGGHMAQLEKTFPNDDCALCIFAPKMVSIYRNPNIHILTLSKVIKVEGEGKDIFLNSNKANDINSIIKSISQGIIKELDFKIIKEGKI